jgi:hypothetical protein
MAAAEQIRPGVLALLALAGTLAGAAQAHPIVYTAYAVTDGRLGAQTFRSAEVRIRIESDSHAVFAAVERGATVLRNERGEATVAVNIAGRTTTARIYPGQVYVRYDLTNGIVGFGSHTIGPTYPLSFSCAKASASNCDPPASGAYDQIVAALAELRAMPQDGGRYSARVSRQLTNLTVPALLTGYTGACATSYVDGRCPAMPSTAIHTDRGDLYFQDQQMSGAGIFRIENDPD